MPTESRKGHKDGECSSSQTAPVCLFRRNDDVAHNSTFRTCSSGPAAASTIFHVCLNAAKMDQTRKHIFHWFSFLCQVEHGVGLSVSFKRCVKWIFYGSPARSVQAGLQLRRGLQIGLQKHRNETRQMRFSFFLYVSIPGCFPLLGVSSAFLIIFWGKNTKNTKKWQIWDLFEKKCLLCCDMKSL